MVCLLGRCFSCPLHTYIVETALNTLGSRHCTSLIHKYGFCGEWEHVDVAFHPFHLFWEPEILLPFSMLLRDPVCVCVCVCVLDAQSCPTLCDAVDCSPPGSSVHGILQAGVLDWVAMPLSKGSFCLWDRTWVSHIAGRFFTI